MSNTSGVSVGAITWKFKGCAREVLTDADSFLINFAPDMSVENKALLIGATMLIDFMFYEKKDNE